jgi:sporulation protein YlmC with PRC-barrel domain
MQQTATAESEVLRVSTLAGNTVVDVAGEALGRIREVMLDVPHGRVAYVVLAFEDRAERGDSDGPLRKLFAVPWEALRLDGARQCFVLDTDRERLRNAPGIDPEHWPSMAQPTWTSALYEFYGVEPYHGD